MPGGPGIAGHGVHQSGDDNGLAHDVAVGNHSLHTVAKQQRPESHVMTGCGLHMKRGVEGEGVRRLPFV